MKEQDILNFSMSGYNRVSSFYCNNHLKGGVFIFLREAILWRGIELTKTYREKSLKLAVMQVISTKLNMLCICAGPSGKLN
jgi:hypothetical protein